MKPFFQIYYFDDAKKMFSSIHVNITKFQQLQSNLFLDFVSDEIVRSCNGIVMEASYDIHECSCSRFTFYKSPVDCTEIIYIIALNSLKITMRFPLLFLKNLHLILIVLLLRHDHAIAQGDLEEKTALYALKTTFNNSFLNQNWSGPPCYMQFPAQWFGVQCVDGRVVGISLEGMGLTGTINSDAFVVFAELRNLSFRNNLLSGNIMDFSNNKMIQRIDLSGNVFHGQIPYSLVKLNFLQSLQLQDNNLTGQIPEFQQLSLTVFNVSNNKLQGCVPETQTLQSFGPDSYINNPELRGPPTQVSCNLVSREGTNETVGSGSSPSSGDDSNKSSNKTKIGTMFLLFDIVGLVAVILLFILYFRKARKLKKIIEKYNEDKGLDCKQEVDEFAEDFVTEERSSVMKSTEARPAMAAVSGDDQSGKLMFVEEEAWFEMNDLLRASAEGLGKGIFGNTYKAKLEGRSSVVVKRLRDLKPLSVEEFTKQLHHIADQKHPNLLPLLAYYYSKDEKLLVYRYASRGNLFNRIHGGKGNKERIPFRWSARLSVARGVARALEYLHQNKSSQSTIVPHGNLKSSNVLLDENERALVSDFGIGSLIALPIASQRMLAYKSPEYQSVKRVFKKTDVWSFGTLLLEILTGRISVHSAPPGTNGVDLCGWVHRAVREEWTAEIFDVEISVQRSTGPGMLKLLQVAMKCCDKSPEKRPEMSEVVREIENIKIVESEDEDDLSLDRSLTDESLSNSASGNISNER